MKIWISSSVEGISRYSYYIEVISYINTIGNSRRLELPFSVYGEGVFIEFQNFIIILLIWTFNKSVWTIEKLVFCTFTFAYAFVLLEGSFMSPKFWDIISSSAMVLLIL